MARPYRSPKIQDTIKKWVLKNPDRWYTAKLEDIHAETGVSVSSLYRYLALIIAKEADIPPSEVIENRRTHMGTSPWRRKLTDAEVSEIHTLFAEGKTTLDIAFVTGRSLSQIQKYKKEAGT